MKWLRAWMMMVAVALAGAGCVTLETTEDREARDQQLTKLQYSVQGLVTERAQMSALVLEARDNQDRLAAENRDLARRLDLLERQYAAADASYKSRLNELQSTINKESDARTKAIQTMGSSVSKTMAEMLKDQEKRINQSLNRAAASSGSQGDYTVKAGDTLTLIAQAFGVSAESVRKANGLKGDTLRAGQRLSIPKK